MGKPQTLGRVEMGRSFEGPFLSRNGNCVKGPAGRFHGRGTVYVALIG